MTLEPLKKKKKNQKSVWLQRSYWTSPWNMHREYAIAAWGFLPFSSTLLLFVLCLISQLLHTDFCHNFQFGCWIWIVSLPRVCCFNKLWKIFSVVFHVIFHSAYIHSILDRLSYGDFHFFLSFFIYLFFRKNWKQILRLVQLDRNAKSAQHFHAQLHTAGNQKFCFVHLISCTCCPVSRLPRTTLT